MKKSERHELMRQLVTDYQIETQEDFVLLLNQKGVLVTQATISRDIKELQLVKQNHNGRFYYTLPVVKPLGNKQKLHKMLQDSLIQNKQMDKLVALKTIPGSAPALGLLIEDIYDTQLFTLLTDDSKVLIICYTEESAKNLHDIFEQIRV